MRGAIFTTNYNEGMKILSDIIDNYDYLYDIRVIDKRSTKESYQYRLDNGDSWTLISSRFGARGRRLHIAYIDRSLGIDFIKEIILPCLICKPFSATHYFGEPKPGEEKYFGLLL